VLGAAMLLFGGYLVLLGSSITRPLADLLHASQEIAGGSLNTAIETRGDDEIGHLGQAFRQMQTSLKRRYDELSLLLDVSKDVSSSMDIGRSMPSILKGALRGTGAAGVRVVVMNPNARQPLVYGEGPASSLMARYDRQVHVLLRDRDELVLATPKEVSDALAPGREPEQIPKALIALPLLSHERRQGIFWVTYRQAHGFDQTELNFLRTLASQASVLVENARLYATAEGGRRRLAAVLASTTDAVIVTDPTEKILLINPAMEHLFDLDATEVAGLPVQSVIDSKPLVTALTGGSRRTRSLEVPTENGKVFYGSASTIFNNDGQAIGRVAVLHDITYLKELDELKSEFVATVSHDLRSPLTFMLGYATMLPMVGQLDNKQQEYVGKIVSGIDKMSGLIDNLLDLGRLEAGVDLVLNDVHVEEVLASVAEDLQQPARSNGIDLVVRTPASLPAVVGDVALIRQAVTNLVNNAIKYAPDSGRVVLGAHVERDEVVISVKDRGPGIAKEDQVRLFEKFFRAKPLQTKGVKGSGLGLALVKSIAERHGGRSWCESEEGKGSTFFMALPVAR
ncbi:MAG: ATP-binding protein, partial [Candidatus Promineifilaceae bacterium]